MRTSVNQDRDFINSVISSSLLEEAVDYIKNNFSMEDIYGIEALEEWAKENDYAKID
jgi:hypothetical protein